MLPALYELAAEYREAAERLQSLELDEQTIADTLEGLSGEIEVKATNVAFMARNMESLAEQIKAAEQAMSARRKAIENRASSLREYLRINMERCNISKIESPQFRISIKQNPASVMIDDERQLPVEFMRQPEPPPPAPDKKAIKAAIESGIAVPGAWLTKTTRVEIK